MFTYIVLDVKIIKCPSALHGAEVFLTVEQNGDRKLFKICGNNTPKALKIVKGDKITFIKEKDQIVDILINDKKVDSKVYYDLY